MLHERTGAAGLKEGNLCLRGDYIIAAAGDDTEMAATGALCKMDTYTLFPTVESIAG